MAIKILSVDDELDLEILLTQYFRRKIRKGEYEFAFAHNGVEALRMLLQDPNYDIILSDINMPEMDGLTLLTKVNEMCNPAMKCIMVSAYGDMNNIRSAMNGGAFDFATKPIDMQDLEKTIEKAIEQITFIKQAQQEHEQLSAIQKDLDVARCIQQAILPKIYPPFPQLTSFDIYASMNAAKSVGGDFYDFFLLEQKKVGFVIADVCDKGVPSALFMAISRTVIRTVALKAASPAECMFEANELLTKESVNNMFVTVFYGIIDTQTGEVVYCNAGHNSPVLVKKDGTTCMVPSTGNMVLGVMEGLPFANKTLQLGADDRLFCYTDGVNEAMDKDNNQYGDVRLLETTKGLVLKSAREMVDAITDSVQQFVGDAPQSDDITMLAIVYKG